MNNIELKVDFWTDLWSNLINNFLKKSFGLTLYNPHILIENIITEIEENKFQNSENKKFFYKKICEYIENDNVIKSTLLSEFKLLRKSFNTNRKNYILSLCSTIDEKFKKGLYFDKTLENIIDLIISEKEITLDFVNSINYYTQSIIVEFIKKSYDLEDIVKFLDEIFDNYKYHNEKTLITKFPHEINPEDFINDDKSIDFTRFNKKVSSLIDNLTLEDRVKKLSYYFTKKKENVTYIFSVEGLKGQVDKQIGDVNFYSLKSKRYTDEKGGLDFENLKKIGNRNSDNKYIQVAVKVNYLLPKTSLTVAISKIENALDIISCYHNLKTELFLDESNYIIVNNDCKMIFSSSGRDKNDAFMKFHDSLDLSDIQEFFVDIEKFSFLWDEKFFRNETVSKLKNAIHWYRKGEDSVKDEDKMLNYWIAIENLFNSNTDVRLEVLKDSNKSKIQLIQEIISSQQIFNFIYDFGWELYYHYRDISSNPFHTKKGSLPQVLIKKAQLNTKTGERIYLKNFIDTLPEIKKFESNLFIIDKIDDVINFYNKPNITKSKILEQINQINNDVLMIYRFRNLIVHNAHFDNTLLPYFVYKTKSFCGRLIRKFIILYSPDKNLADIILNIQIEKEKFLLDFEKGKVNLFND